MMETKKMLQFFGALADETRLKMLMELSKGPTTVQKLHHVFKKEKLTLSAISHQLKYLDHLDIVQFEKKGREKHFRLSPFFCWCILRNAEHHFGSKTACKGCVRVLKRRNSTIF